MKASLRPLARIAAGTLGILVGVGVALSALSPAQQTILDGYAATAKAKDPAFTQFSAERGRVFFQATHTGGKAATPSCTTCHTADPKKTGTTRAGKTIDPMAGSANPKRYTDPKEVEKWYLRNCSDVLGRECTVLEKGDVMVYLLGI